MEEREREEGTYPSERATAIVTPHDMETDSWRGRREPYRTPARVNDAPGACPLRSKWI